tara:strand:+ start:318 stop:533 length:216 start_codon:yes stop_codon:yes gene_type:complete
MNKELIAKQMKLLGLFFGTWALLLVNSLMFEFLLDMNLVGYVIRSNGDPTISLFALTIFQMWAIYKYILKK